MPQPPTPSANAEDLFCPQCSYNLRGNPSGRCPECGITYDPADISASRIPWTARHHIGRLKAWWRTILVTTFRSHLLAESLQADLLLTDARRFWLTCILPLCAGAAALLFSLHPAHYFPSLGIDLSRAPTSAPSMQEWLNQLLIPWHLAATSHTFLCVIAIPATLSLTLLPVRISSSCRYPSPLLRARAASAAHYLAGALLGGALIGLAVAAAAAIIIIAMADTYRLREALPLMLSVFPPAAASLLWTLAIYRFQRRIASPGTFLLLFPPFVCLVLCVWLILVPWVVGLLWLIVSTLRG